MSRSIGRQVHGWQWPVVWWARRKPRSHVRQWLWKVTDQIQWWRTRRAIRKTRRASRG